MRMANTNLYDEEDYIDIELTSSPKFFANSSPQNREFEFQMALSTNEKGTTTSPADELFYKGKLLPLYLPPRRQTVENLLLHHPTTAYHTAPCTHTTNTPLDSCNVSPSESRRVSCELNPDDYYFEWSAELSSFINTQYNYNPTKKSWSKKLKQIKQYSVLSQKLKASRAYLKSFFTKTACSDDQSFVKLPEAADEASNKYLLKINAKKKPFGGIGKAAYPTIATVIENIDREGINEDNSVHRRSFSGAIKRHSMVKGSSSSSSMDSSNSSSFSINSNCSQNEMQFLRRNSSATEIEGSIEAAIAHCKKSEKLFDERNTSNIIICA